MYILNYFFDIFSEKRLTAGQVYMAALFYSELIIILFAKPDKLVYDIDDIVV